MKNRFIILTALFFLATHIPASAQDSSRHGAVKEINKASEQADKINGKKIQQQTLSTTPVQKLSPATPASPKKKLTVKRKHKRS